MNKSKVLLTTLVAGSISAALAQQPADNAQLLTPVKADQIVESRYIIKFKEAPGLAVAAANGKRELNVQAAERAVQAVGGQMKLAMRGNMAVAAVLDKAQLKRLSKNPNVDYVEVDHPRRLMAQTQPYGISMVQADQVSDAAASAGAGGKKICVIDSGLEMPHEDMGSFGGTINGTNNSGTGNWYDQGGPHGTHVAGTIAAINNSTGVRGVIGSNPSMHIVKVFNASGWGYTSSLISAIEVCANNGSDVVNMSLGGGGASQTEANAMQQLADSGVLLIAAAGNDGSPNRSTDALSYPASYNAVVSVAAVDSNKNLAGFSQKNSQVEIAAPGVSVLSTYPTGTGSGGGNYGTMSGTSMASPHVAGVAALVWSNYPSCSASQIRNALNASAQDLGASGRDVAYGFGLVQAKDAMDYLAANGCSGGGGGSQPPSGAELSNGVAKTNLSGGTGSASYFTLEVPAGASDLNFSMAGGSGDADLYVRYGSQPTTSTYDCRPYLGGNNESCDISSVQAGTYHVMIRGYSSYSGVSLTGSYTEPTSGGTGGSATANDLSGASGSFTHYYVDIPAGMSSLNVDLSGGTGDADLYVRFNSQPTTSSYNCRPFLEGNNESCSISDPQEGRWYVSVRGYSAYSGADLFVEWQP
ncbi:MAG TPA: S8 family serine peptidase [Pseudidiomarina sp.]|nr:S8 family serine peptidase [Pseudidiomarina sp.]